jgi:chaperonin GroEL
VTVRAIRYADEAREGLLHGIDTLADAVKATLGPRGHNVALERRFGLPLVVNDGVTVAKEIDLEDPFEIAGASLVRQAAEKAEERTGDGTTTATVLAQAIVHEGFRNVAAGADPMALRRGLEHARRIVDEHIDAAAIPVRGKRAIGQVAAISAHDEELGRLIGNVMARVGPDGAVSVEESQTIADQVEYGKGLEIEQGYLSPYFVTDADRMEAVVERPAILITDKRLAVLDDILPILDKLIASGRKDLVVVAQDVSGEALATLVVNRLRGTLNVIAVKAPGFGERRAAALGDLATITGSSLISEELGKRADRLALDDLGSARRVVSTRERTTIIDGGGRRAAIDSRIAELRAQLAEAEREFDREDLRKRLAKLTGGVAVLRIGGSTETELTEKRHRVEDAVSAARSALEGGIVPGGGVVLLAAAEALDGLDLPPEEAIGVRCLGRALTEPMRQIAVNAGFDGGVVVETVRRLRKGGRRPRLGFDADRGRYVDMVKAGIVDPANVTHAALDAAVSTAAMVLTTEAVVVEPNPDQESPSAEWPQ